MIRHTAYMMVSTALRALASLIALGILARSWTPAEFGFFTFAFTLTNLIVVVVDYGFGLQVVRDAARAPSRVSQIVAEAVQAKLALSLVVVLGLTVILVVRQSTPAMIITIALQLGAALAASFGLVFNLGLRGIGRFDSEAGAVAAGSAVLVVVTAIVAVAGGDAIAASVGLLLARIVYLAISTVSFGRIAGLGGLVVGRLKDWFRLAFHGIPFGLHMVLGTVYFQIDTLLLQRLLGLEAVGVYQAAFRLLVGGLLVTDAVSNVYLQRISGVAGDRQVLLAETNRLVRRFSTVGLIGAIILTSAAGLLGRVVFGSQYGAADKIIALLGVVLYLRSYGAAYGILLTVTERQTVRTIVTAVAVLLSIALNLLFIPRFGLSGAVLASVAVHLGVNAAYVLAVRLTLGTAGLDVRTVVQLLGATALFTVTWTGMAATPVIIVAILAAALGIVEVGRAAVSSHTKPTGI